MTDFAVHVEKLSKVYSIGQREAAYETARESLVNLATAPFRRMFGAGSGAATETTSIWALRDVSFDVARGEVLGLIGRNGAGKTTLLKILSRITEPTEGYVEIDGRVGSLLEVGTGFHPELTGRENIYLSGAILGMKRAEINRRFHEIVEFSEIGQFLDTPVKRYSSGMQMRLAFSVAAHLETEILMVDEVLAVGDVEFQRRCLGRMSEVASSGRTVLFVSHNLGAVAELCSRAIVLAQGSVICDDTPATAIDAYLSHTFAARSNERILARKPDVLVQVVKLSLHNEMGEPVSEIEMGDDIFLTVEYLLARSARDVTMAALVSRNETPLLYSYDSDVDESLKAGRSGGAYRAVLRLPTGLFKEGSYTVAVLIGYQKENLTDPDAFVQFEISNSQRDLTHKSYKRERPGVLAQDIVWHTEIVTRNAVSSVG